MSSPWDFNSLIGSFMIVLAMAGLLVLFSTLVYKLVVWIWRDEIEVAETPRMSRSEKEFPFRKAA